MGGENRANETAAGDKESTKDGKLNTLQMAAATGASTTAAVVANLLGIYGTVIGVAVISIVSSVATVLYLKSMHRTQERLRKVVRSTNAATTALRAKTGGADPRTVRAPTPDETATESTDSASPPQTEPNVAATETSATRPLNSPTVGTASIPTEPADDDQKPGSWWLRNGRTIAVSSLIVFCASIAALTGIALLSGQPPNTFYQTSPNPAIEQRDPGGSDDTDPQQQDPESDEPSTEPSSQTPSETPSDTPSDSEEPSDPESPSPTDTETTPDSPTTPEDDDPGGTDEPDPGDGEDDNGGGDPAQ
ncbi:MAG: hypothetical protein ACRD0P_23535 [Stackebrandtia sp.]